MAAYEYEVLIIQIQCIIHNSLVRTTSINGLIVKFVLLLSWR